MSRKGVPNKVIRRVDLVCRHCGSEFQDYPSRASRKFCSTSCGAKARADITRQRSLGNTWGSLRKCDGEFRQRMSVAHKGKRRPAGSIAKMGERNPNWRGGTSPENKRIRRSAEFRHWRTAVFERDNYTCQLCGQRGGDLHPDHIKQFAYYPELRFDVDNGRTLCAPCHRKTPTWGYKGQRRAS